MKIFQSATRIVLLAVVFTMCYMAIQQIPVSEQFQSIVQTVVAFFLGTKVNVTEVNKG